MKSDHLTLLFAGSVLLWACYLASVSFYFHACKARIIEAFWQLDKIVHVKTPSQEPGISAHSSHSLFASTSLLHSALPGTYLQDGPLPMASLSPSCWLAASWVHPIGTLAWEHRTGREIRLEVFFSPYLFQHCLSVSSWVSPEPWAPTRELLPHDSGSLLVNADSNITSLTRSDFPLLLVSGSLHILGLFPVCVCALVDQLCPTLCDPSVHRILKARILEWVAISFSTGSSQPRDQTWISCTAGRFLTIWAMKEARYTSSKSVLNFVFWYRLQLLSVNTFSLENFVLKSQHLGTTRLSCLFPISASVLHEGLCVEGAGEGGLQKPHLNHCISWRVSTVKDCKGRWESSMTTALPTQSLNTRTKGPTRGLGALMISQWDIIWLVLPPPPWQRTPPSP